jgi:dTDP-4-dehydrorhamnose reductase
MLGSACVRVFRERFGELHATVRSLDAPAAATLGAELHAFDVWWDNFEDLFASVRPDAVVNCIGLVKQLEEAKRPRAAIRLNALFPHEVAEVCGSAGARLLHVSTDCVFAGKLPLGQSYREDHVPDASDLYGLSKLLGEVSAPALTVRTSIIGPELERSSGLLEWFRRQEGGSVTGFTQAIFTGLTTTALAHLLADVLESQPHLAGLYHVAAEPISKYDLLLLLRETLGIDCEISPAEVPVINRALDGRQFVADSGLTVPSWEQMMTAYSEKIDV